MKLKTKLTKIGRDPKKNKGFALSLKLAIRKSKFNNFFWIGADNPNRNILKILKKFIQVGINNKNKFVIIQYYNDKRYIYFL